MKCINKNNVCNEPITEVAVDKSEIEDYRKKNNHVCFFLVAGRMIYRKGITFLLDALERIPEESGYQVRIVGDGPELKGLKERCRNNHNLSSHVHFTGMIPYIEMEEEYKQANVFIMPSIRETTGTVLLESMSKGVPIITINRFGGATLLDENSAWLYGGTDQESYIQNLKNAIIECISCPAEVERRGENARKKVESYTWQKKMIGYQAIYNEVLKL